MRIIRTIVSISLLAVGTPSQAALPPSAVNLRDFNTMVKFISKHQVVTETLTQIDLISLNVFLMVIAKRISSVKSRALLIAQSRGRSLV